MTIADVWTTATTGTTNTPWYCSCAVSTIMPYEMEWIQNYEVRVTKPQLIMGQGMIIGELAPLSFHTFLLFKYPIRVKLTQNILREILDISLDYWWLRYKCLSDMGGFSLGWNLTKSAFGLSIEFRGPDTPNKVTNQSQALTTWPMRG